MSFAGYGNLRGNTSFVVHCRPLACWDPPQPTPDGETPEVGQTGIENGQNCCVGETYPATCGPEVGGLSVCTEPTQHDSAGSIGPNVILQTTTVPIQLGSFVAFDVGSLNDLCYTGNGYRVKEGIATDLWMISCNVRYNSMNPQYPYEVIKLALIINGSTKLSRIYGFDAQGRIKDEYVIELEPNDIVQFQILPKSGSSTTQVELQENSFITFSRFNTANFTMQCNGQDLVVTAWTDSDIRALRKAVREYPRTLNKVSRWRKIGLVVGRTPHEAYTKYRELKAERKSKTRRVGLLAARHLMREAAYEDDDPDLDDQVDNLFLNLDPDIDDCITEPG